MSLEQQQQEQLHLLLDMQLAVAADRNMWKTFIENYLNWEPTAFTILREGVRQSV